MREKGKGGEGKGELQSVIEKSRHTATEKRGKKKKREGESFLPFYHLNYLNPHLVTGHGKKGEGGR